MRACIGPAAETTDGHDSTFLCSCFAGYQYGRKKNLKHFLDSNEFNFITVKTVGRTGCGSHGTGRG
jgi:hypothetical protein